MISIIEREIVDKHHWIERNDFLDLLAIAQSLPGILAVNIATAVGDKIRGGKGSVVASLGTILPSFFIILAIAIFLTPRHDKEQQGDFLNFHGNQAGCGGSHNRPGDNVGQSSKPQMENSVDSIYRGSDDLPRHGHCVKPYPLYIAWRSGRVPFLVAASALS